MHGLCMQICLQSGVDDRLRQMCESRSSAAKRLQPIVSGHSNACRLASARLWHGTHALAVAKLASKVASCFCPTSSQLQWVFVNPRHRETATTHGRRTHEKVHPSAYILPACNRFPFTCISMFSLVAWMLLPPSHVFVQVPSVANGSGQWLLASSSISELFHQCQRTCSTANFE